MKALGTLLQAVGLVLIGRADVLATDRRERERAARWENHPDYCDWCRHVIGERNIHYSTCPNAPTKPEVLS